MNLVELFAARGLRLYIGMPAETFVACLTADTGLEAFCSDIPSMVDMVANAVNIRKIREKVLQEAENELLKARNISVVYNKGSVESFDKFDKGAQSAGAFSPIMLVGASAPTGKLTGPFLARQSSNLIGKYTRQITNTIPECEREVILAKSELDYAKEREQEFVDEFVRLLIATHI